MGNPLDQIRDIQNALSGIKATGDLMQAQFRGDWVFKTLKSYLTKIICDELLAQGPPAGFAEQARLSEEAGKALYDAVIRAALTRKVHDG